MKWMNTIGIFAIVALLLAAQQQPTPKVVTANPAKIFAKIRETGDLNKTLSEAIKKTSLERENKNKAIQQLTQQRDAFKPEDAQWNELSGKLMQASIELESWSKITEANLQRSMKSQTRALYDKILATTADIAVQHGVDLVLADRRAEIPGNFDSLTLEQMKVMLNDRSVLYNSGTADISDAVAAAMDAKYQPAK